MRAILYVMVMQYIVLNQVFDSIIHVGKINSHSGAAGIYSFS